MFFRFTPGFLHNLHHMVHDLNVGNNGTKGGCNGVSSGNGPSGIANPPKKKRSGGALTSGSNGVISEVEGSAPTEAEMTEDVIEQLHELFKRLSCADEPAEGEQASFRRRKKAS